MGAEDSVGAEDLDALAARLAEGLDGVTAGRTATATEYARQGRVFASASATALEVRLHSDVAAAALRTSHTTASGRGAEWVLFEPLEIDRFGLDRAEAWFLSAWRAAA